MFQRYQQYFKDEKYKFLLKYDGKRNAKRYTVRVFDSTDPEKVYGKDTDSPQKEFLEILDSISININPEENVMLTDFSDLRDLLIRKYGVDVIYSTFFCDIDSELFINLDIVVNESNINYQCKSISDIKSYILNLQPFDKRDVNTIY